MSPPDRNGMEPRPLLVAGGEVDESSVCLRFFGDDLNPDEITKKLGAAASTASRKGEVTQGKRGSRIEPRGKWLLSVEGEPGVPLEVLINRLLDGLTQDLGVWCELASRFQPDLYCGLHLANWNRGCGFSTKTLQRIAERGLELGLDIYFDGDEGPAS